LPSRRQTRRFEEILENIELIERFVTGLDYAVFAGNKQVLYAVFHALLIISEAARKLQGDTERLIPDQPWPAIRAIGNVLRHQYDDVDPVAIWQVVRHELAPLKTAVEQVLRDLRSAESD
jgi:uncharacterized protein with HEPN domain